MGFRIIIGRLLHAPGKAYQLYMKLLNEHPWKTQVISTGILFGIGDIICQNAVEKVKIHKHDVMRTLRISAVGLLTVGPVFCAWYSMLDRRYQGKKNVLKKVCWDQGLLAPVFFIYFHLAVGIVEGRNYKQIKERLEKEFVPGMIVNYEVWPAIQLLNFYFVPAHHRVLVVNIASVFWNTYLAWTAFKAMQRTALVEKLVDKTVLDQSSLSEDVEKKN